MKDVHVYCDACHTEILTQHAEVHYENKSAAAGVVNGEVVEPLDFPNEIDFHQKCLLSLAEPAYSFEVRA